MKRTAPSIRLVTSGEEPREGQQEAGGSLRPAVLRLSGALGPESVDQLRLLLAEVADAGRSTEVHLDVSGVSSCSSEALAELTLTARQFAAAGSRLVLVDPIPELHHLAWLNGATIASLTDEEDPADRSGSDISPTLADVLIKEIFGIGLALAGVRSQIGTSPAAEALGEAIDRLDGLVRDLREAVLYRDVAG